MPPPTIRGSSSASPTSRPASTSRRSPRADVTLSPARWEGLGLPLYEAVAFGQPAITNDVAPMNEITRHEENGLLVRSTPDGDGALRHPGARLRSGGDGRGDRPSRRGRRRFARDLSAGSAALREGERAWENTVRGFGSLLELAGL